MAEVRDLAYSIVTTILSRLHRQGPVARQLSGRGGAYRLAQDEAHTAQAMLALLGRGHDRDAVPPRILTSLVTRT